MKLLVSLPSNIKDKKASKFFMGVDHLKKMGHSITDTSDVSSLDKKIKNADIIICDSDLADEKVGFEISKAIMEKKVVVIFSHKSSKKSFFSTLEGKNVLTEKYDNSNFPDVFENSIKKASNKIDSKFILIISPEIERYLQWASKTKRMHKAQIVRLALEASIKKDKEYMNFNQ